VLILPRYVGNGNIRQINDKARRNIFPDKEGYMTETTNPKPAIKKQVPNIRILKLAALW
jgi:hypothetical protein